jgi:hypothetical protein
MKYCIHVTLTASIEVEASSAKQAKDLALQSTCVQGGNQFTEYATVFETYAAPKPTQKGKGSY